MVGVDGSPESSAALQWAAGAVGRSGVVHVLTAVGASVDAAAAELRCEEWTAHLRTKGQRIECRVTEGRAADALIDVGREVTADVIVVGVHHKPRHLPRTIGRVTAELIRESDRPLVVVDGGESSLAPGCTVVADVATGAATQAAVWWAASFADSHDAALQLVHSRPTRPYLGPDGLLEVMAFYIDPDVLVQWAAEDLDDLVEEIQRSTDHELEINWSSALGRRGAHVAAAAETAALIVIGRHSMPGSSRVVSHDLRHVITNAPCPVVVVPPSDSGRVDEEPPPRAR